MYKITEKLAEKLKGKVCFKDQTFNPVQDIKGDWFISAKEVEQCTNWRYREDLKGLKKE